jgi:hypothetical protein
MQVCKIGGHFENGRHLGSDTKIEVANGVFFNQLNV